MLNQSLRAAAALNGWRILRSVVTFFIVSVLIVFGTQIVVGHPAKAQDKVVDNKVVNKPVTPQNQDRKNLYVSNLTLRRYGDTTGESPLVVNDTAGTVALEWSNTFPGASEERPVAGKSFTVDLPKELIFAQSGVEIKPVSMKHSSGEVVGECTFEMRRAVCAFDNRAEQLWEKNTRNFRGKFDSWVSMTVPTDGRGTTVPLIVNGQNLDITLPGGVIKDQSRPGDGSQWYKSVGSVDPGKDTLYWYFKITGKYLQEQFKNKKIAQTMDGRTPFTMILKDVAEAPLYFEAEKLNDLKIRKQVFTRTCTVEEAETPGKRGSVCGTVTKSFDGSTIEYKIDPNDPKRVDLIITGPFSPEDVYTINGLNTTVHGKINTGIKYKNNARLAYQAPDGTTTDVNDVYVRSAEHVEKNKVTVEYDQERGFFVVEKRVDGDILAIDPEQTSFDVEFTYELPNGTTFADWKDLEPLKAMSTNVTDHGGTATFKVGAFKQGFPTMAKKGQPLVNIPFPTGTRITLRENIDTNTPFQHVQTQQGERYWGAPRYAVDNDVKDQANANPVSFTIKKATKEKVETKVYLHNEIENRNGTFSVKKTIAGVHGDGAGEKVFKFNYVCGAVSGQLDVPANGVAVPVRKTFPIGTKCTIDEQDQDTAIADHVFNGKPHAQTIVIGKTPVEVPFTNSYSPVGSFEVAKRVEGIEVAALQGKTFSFDYVCGDVSGRIENVLPGGPAVAATQTFRTGTTCTVSESLEAAKVEGYTLAAHKPVEVTIGAPGAPLAKAEFLNKYTRDLGSFKIRKSVKGDGNFTSDSFNVQYRCGAAEPVTLNLKGNEEWTVVENLPTGTECVISEDQATAKRAGFTEAIKIDNPTVTIDKTKVAEVTVTNTYAQNKGGFTISKSLAGTGQNRAKDKEFTFSYKCTDPQGDVVKEEKQLKVKAGEVKRITDVPELATCVVEELDGDVQNADLKTVVNVELEGGEVATPEAEKPASPAAPANNDAPVAPAENAVTPANDAAAAPQPVVAVPVADAIEDAGEAANENPAEGEAAQPAPAQPAAPAAPADNAPAVDAPADQAPAVVVPEKPEKQDAPVVASEGVVEGNKATFTVGKDTTHKVLVVNEYTDHVGTLSVTKVVEGDAAAMLKDQPFIFDVKCEDGQSKVLEVPGNGTPVESGLKIPVGTKCEVSEQTDKAQRAGFDLKAPEKQEVTIAKRDEVVAATFKNEYIKHVGTFSVAKNVKGLTAEEGKNKEYLFNFSCVDGQKGEVKVKGDGVAVDAGVKIPVGTDCTVTENAASAEVKGFKVKLPESQNIRFEKKDQKFELAFTNEYRTSESAAVPGDPKPNGDEEVDPKDPPKNTPPSPGILSFLPFIPFLFGNGGSSGTPNGTNADTVAGANNTTNGNPGGTNNTTNGNPGGINNTANPAGQKGVLANTGASVIGIGLLALVVTSVGIFLAIRGRKSKS